MWKNLVVRIPRICRVLIETKTELRPKLAKTPETVSLLRSDAWKGGGLQETANYTSKAMWGKRLGIAER